MAKAKTPSTNPTNKQVITMPEAGSVPLARKTSPLNDSPVDVAAQIRERAYQLYQERGTTPGHENEDWLRAEREILTRQNHQQTA
ncbi:MAG TPA: DUF2934 domain-containing protein [Terriglobales bacterium]|nr:DUF2934 domain-containing protein [Terriglobales bacterium]